MEFFGILVHKDRENFLDSGVFTLINAYIIANNLFTIEPETVSVKWRYFVLDSCFAATLADINAQSPKFKKDSVEAAEASYQSTKHDSFFKK